MPAGKRCKTYLAYVHGGTCIDDQAPSRDDNGLLIKKPRIRKQFYVERKLQSMGIDAWAGRRVNFMRRGKRSFWEAVEEPAFPNYLFITMDVDQMAQAVQVDHLSPTFQELSRRDRDGASGVPSLDEIKRAVGDAYAEAQRVDANNRASVSGYKAGQAIKVLNGLFEYADFKFEKLVHAPGVRWHKVRVSSEVMGRVVYHDFDPLDVRAAE